MTELGRTCHIPYLNETPITVDEVDRRKLSKKTPEALRDEGPKTDNRNSFTSVQTERKDRVMAEGQFVSLL